MNNNRPLVDRLREALALPKIGPCFTSADFTTPEDVGITKENARLAPVHEALVEVVDCLDELRDIESEPGAVAQMDSFTFQPMRTALAKLEQAVAAMERDK